MNNKENRLIFEAFATKLIKEDMPYPTFAKLAKHASPKSSKEKDENEYKEQMPDSKEEYSAHDYAKEMEAKPGEQEEQPQTHVDMSHDQKEAAMLLKKFGYTFFDMDMHGRDYVAYFVNEKLPHNHAKHGIKVKQDGIIVGPADSPFIGKKVKELIPSEDAEEQAEAVAVSGQYKYIYFLDAEECYSINPYQIVPFKKAVRECSNWTKARVMVGEDIVQILGKSVKDQKAWYVVGAEAPNDHVFEVLLGSHHASQEDEHLIGGQHKLDANHDGKISGADFKILKKRKSEEQQKA